MRLRLKILACAVFASLALFACKGETQQEQQPVVTNPNRLSPGLYTQSALAIPATLNDPLHAATTSWIGDYASYLWGFDFLGVFPVFASLSLPAPELVVAVIDTGVDKDHPDLVGRLWVNQGEYGGGKHNNGADDDHNGFVDDYLGWDFANGTNNPADDSGHGTHVAGTIAAIGNNGAGIVGIAPWVRIMALKVCNQKGECDSSDIRAALAYARANGARIANLSLGAEDRGPDAQAFNTAITEATDGGMLVVVAAGNESIDTKDMSPANSNHALAVSAIRTDELLCGFSNTGWKVDVSAPGCGARLGYEGPGILSLNSKKCGAAANEYCAKSGVVSEGYVLKQGTSMAAPHIAGMAALALTANPAATPLQIRQALLRSGRLGAGTAAHSRLFGAYSPSGTSLLAEIDDAPGIKFRSPWFGTSSSSHALTFRIEAGPYDVSWALKYIDAGAGSPLNLATQGTLIDGAEGNVGAFTTNPGITVNWTPPSAGDFLVVLEATANSRTYYDLLLVSKP